MKHCAPRPSFRCFFLTAACVVLLGCQSTASQIDASTENTNDAFLATVRDVSAAGGATGGMPGSGGVPGTGGALASGGIQGNGGRHGSGGALGAGGTIASGGVTGTSGNPGVGGTPATGGKPGSGGALGTGGKGSTGGATSTGGLQNLPDASRDSASCEDSGSSTLVHLSPQQLKDLLAAQDVYLVNVKSPSAPDIAGTDLDLQAGTDATPTVTAIEDLVGHNTCADIVIYCVSGNTSQRVANQLISLGYRKVQDLQGGITAWQAQGFPVAKAGGDPG
jgi:rhodanese-related sulfurtransferase